MTPTNPDERKRHAPSMAEPSSWWLFVAILLGALGCYGVLVVHLLLDATRASAWGLAWMAVPGLFFCGSLAALFVASGMPIREKLAAIPAALLGYSPPRERSKPHTGARLCEPV
jgi:hypothetical protein